MAHGITEDDLERIAEFMREPPHRRRPDLLRPDDDGDDPGTRAVDGD